MILHIHVSSTAGETVINMEDLNSHGLLLVKPEHHYF